MDYVSFKIAFWNDPIVIDMASREKYVFNYLFTSPLLKLCGCYEITEKQIAYHTGLDEQAVHFAMVELCETHKRIGYTEETHEVIIFNFGKWNWIDSPTFYTKLRQEIMLIKSVEYRSFALKLLEKKGRYPDTVSIPYGYHYIRNSIGLSLTNISQSTDKDLIPQEREPTIEEMKAELAKYDKPKDDMEEVNKVLAKYKGGSK